MNQNCDGIIIQNCDGIIILITPKLFLLYLMPIIALDCVDVVCIGAFCVNDQVFGEAIHFSPERLTCLLDFDGIFGIGLPTKSRDAPIPVNYQSIIKNVVLGLGYSQFSLFFCYRSIFLKIQV